MEFVYVVKRSELFDLSAPHGFVAGGSEDGRVETWTERIRQRGFFLERRWAERDAAFKQIIPYTLVTCADRVLLLRRLVRGGEARLHGKLSVGVGGHINPVDGGEADAGGGADLLAAGCRRELEEELAIGSPYELTTVGVINDDATDVGAVHFGLVNVARCERPEVSIRETDALEGQFVSRVELAETVAAERHRFETWSALILDRLPEILAR